VLILGPMTEHNLPVPLVRFGFFEICHIHSEVIHFARSVLMPDLHGMRGTRGGPIEIKVVIQDAGSLRSIRSGVPLNNDVL